MVVMAAEVFTVLAEAAGVEVALKGREELLLLEAAEERVVLMPLLVLVALSLAAGVVGTKVQDLIVVLVVRDCVALQQFRIGKMNKTLINSVSNNWVNVISLPDNWTGAEGEWQIPDGHEFVDGNGGSGHVWDGTQFIDPNQITEEEQTENYLAIVRVERNDLLHTSDWTQGNDSPLTDEVKTSWATYRQELRDLPETYTADPDSVVWPQAPE
jgi:hypothetical protein